MTDSTIVCRNMLKNIQKPVAYLYGIIMKRRAVSTEKYLNAWRLRLNDSIIREDYNLSFKWLYKVTDDVKLRDFQYRLLLNKIFVNETLFRWKVVETNTCNLCNVCLQTITHLLFECRYAKSAWKQIKSYTEHIDQLNWSLSNVLLGNVHENHNNVVNLIVLITKRLLFQQKCLNEKPTKNKLCNEILFYYKYECYTKGVERTNKKWSPMLLNKFLTE